jgi:hypothetical protein
VEGGGLAGTRDSFLNLVKLKDAVTAGKVTVIPLNENIHKDVVFSFRYAYRQVGTNPSNVFLIESETTNRDPESGRMIGPNNGGWVRIIGGVPVITRGSYEDNIMQAEIWQVEDGNGVPVGNEEVQASQITVVSGTGAVTILNAAGKKVTISNILGQKVAAALLNSDNATLEVPKGIVIVAVEGENAVKAVVK